MNFPFFFRKTSQKTILYKYMSPGQVTFLENPGLRLTPPSALNDPFECLPRLKVLGKTADELEKLWELVVQKRFASHTLAKPEGVEYDTYRLKCLPGRTEWILQAQQNLESEAALEASLRLQGLTDTSIGVVCLSESRDNMLMWSHYAASHSGFVFGFDVLHRVFRPLPPNPADLGKLKKVAYTHSRFVIPKSMRNAATEDFSYIFHKSPDWAYEREWRLALPIAAGSPIDGGITIYKLPRETLKEIVIGFRASLDLRRRLESFAKLLPGVQVLYAYPSTVTFSMRVSSKENSWPHLNE